MSDKNKYLSRTLETKVAEAIGKFEFDGDVNLRWNVGDAAAIRFRGLIRFVQPLPRFGGLEPIYPIGLIGYLVNYNQPPIPVFKGEVIAPDIAELVNFQTRDAVTISTEEGV